MDTGKDAFFSREETNQEGRLNASLRTVFDVFKNPSKEVLCPRCNGRGLVRCLNPVCENGQITLIMKGKWFSRKTEKTAVCDICHGTGRMKCKRCMGEGTITV
jgi:DnaJ-class molecular chaperone